MIAQTRTVELARLVSGLPARERRGSRPRCVLLTHGTPQRVADRLTALTAADVAVSANDRWFPRGFDDPREITLGDCDERLLDRRLQQALARWWLATTGTLPTWDLVSTASAGRIRALILAEAKAHTNELIEGRRWRRSAANQAQISRALAEATTALESVMPGWDLMRAPYQLANRIAWGWKIASLGVPVVLSYLGFLHAAEMQDRGDWIVDDGDWERIMRAYSRHAVPSDAWGRVLHIGDAWLQLEFRTTHIPLPTPCPSCGGQLRWILYGMPTDQVYAAASGGDYLFGGCCVADDSPTHECERCHAGVRIEPHRRSG